MVLSGMGSVQKMYRIWGSRSILNEAKRPDQESSTLAKRLVSLVILSGVGNLHLAISRGLLLFVIRSMLCCIYSMCRERKPVVEIGGGEPNP